MKVNSARTAFASSLSSIDQRSIAANTQQKIHVCCAEYLAEVKNMLNKMVCRGIEYVWESIGLLANAEYAHHVDMNG